MPNFSVVNENNYTLIDTPIGEYISPEDINKIFTTYKHLQSLTLSFLGHIYGYTISQYSKEHAEVLSKCLATYNGPLKKLNLYVCNIPDDGMIAILTAIMQNPILSKQMTSMYLQDNDITESTINFIHDIFLPACPNITFMQLAGQKMGKGLRPIWIYDSGREIEYKYQEKIYAIEKICNSRKLARAQPPAKTTLNLSSS